MAAEKNTDLYFFFLSGSTFLYIANATPINEALESITCPALKRAGTTDPISWLYEVISPACLKLFKSVIQASHNGSCPATTCPAVGPVSIW